MYARQIREIRISTVEKERKNPKKNKKGLPKAGFGKTIERSLTCFEDPLHVNKSEKNEAKRSNIVVNTYQDMAH